jgi:hypothetical protein
MVGALKPATDDMVKAGVKAGGVATQKVRAGWLVTSGNADVHDKRTMDAGKAAQTSSWPGLIKQDGVPAASAATDSQG